MRRVFVLPGAALGCPGVLYSASARCGCQAPFETFFCRLRFFFWLLGGSSRVPPHNQSNRRLPCRQVSYETFFRRGGWSLSFAEPAQGGRTALLTRVRIRQTAGACNRRNHWAFWQPLGIAAELFLTFFAPRQIFFPFVFAGLHSEPAARNSLKLQALFYAL